MQVCLTASQASGSPIALTGTQEDHLRSSENAYYSALLQTTKGHKLPSPLESFCPHPALVQRKFLDDLEYFHEAFGAALTNIVQRWFGDSTANFSSRMPLESHEVQLLEDSATRVARPSSKTSHPHAGPSRLSPAICHPYHHSWISRIDPVSRGLFPGHRIQG